jgi:hypothetical protein
MSDFRRTLIKTHSIPGLMKQIEESENPLRYAQLWRYLDRIRFDLTETGVVMQQDITKNG